MVWARPQEASLTGGNSQTWAGWVSAHWWFPAPDELSTLSLPLGSWRSASSSFVCNCFTSLSSNLPTFLLYSACKIFHWNNLYSFRNLFHYKMNRSRDVAHLYAVSSSSQFLGRKSPLPSDTFGVGRFCPAPLLYPLFLWCLPLSPFIVISLLARALHYPDRL